MMTAAQYRKHIEQLGMTQRGAARFFGINDRTSRRFALEGEVPFVIELLLRVMVKYGVAPDEAFQLTRTKQPDIGFGDGRVVEEE